jgi:hypothetical protein
MRKLFEVLAAILVVGFFVSCSGGGSSNEDKGLSINESYDFPPFDIPAISVTHYVTRNYSSLEDLEDVLGNFKAMGAYYGNQYNPNAASRDNPLGNSSHVTKARMDASVNTDFYTITTIIDVNGTDIERSDELFEKIFGYTDAPIIRIQVDKQLANNTLSQLALYGQSLTNEEYGFDQTSTNQWTHYDNDDNDIFYTWGYGSQYGITSAHWTIAK